MSSLQGAPLPDFTLPYTSHAPGGQNGRVSFHPAGAPSASGRPVPDGAGFRYPTQTEVSFAGEALRGNWEKNAVSDAFFTRENVRRIQEALKKGVYEASGNKKYQISDQSTDELTVVMRGMYLQYSRNTPYNIEGQVQELNDMVVKWSVPRILSEIEGYYGYLKDISTLPVPLPQPIHLSSAGTRSLPYKNPL